MWRPQLPSVQPLTDPAAGQPAIYVPASAAGELIEAVTFFYAPAGGGAPRVATVTYFDNDGIEIGQAVAPFTLASGKSSLYSFFVGAAQYGANDAEHIGGPLPGFALSRNHRVEVSAAALGAADHIANVRLIVSKLAGHGEG